MIYLYTLLYAILKEGKIINFVSNLNYYYGIESTPTVTYYN